MKLYTALHVYIKTMTSPTPARQLGHWANDTNREEPVTEVQLHGFGPISPPVIFTGKHLHPCINPLVAHYL